MNELIEIYKRIEYLRNNGVKMKEIADHTQMAASVISSLYSSVLPTYIGEVKKGIAEEEALDYALSQVNNVSKKRLLGSLESMKARLLELEPPQEGEKRKSPFWEMMAKESRASAQKANNYSGIYMSYSLSSAADALKVEPYLIAASENNEYIRLSAFTAEARGGRRFAAVMVINSGRPYTGADQGKRVGLKNIEDRLAIFSPDAFFIVRGGIGKPSRCVILIPIQ